mmetsp:Transcript_42338/g.99554  ORF Transcript_42338/g.99554 Transcript_42338/m.99554 type:complete len:200 (-) Transcript_42338:1633-2232(-)
MHGKAHRLLAGAALPVNRHRRDGFGQPRRQYGMTAQVAVLLVPLQHAADDHIVQIGGVDAGALDQLAQRLAQQIDGVPFLQAPAALAHGGAQRTDDDGFMVIHVLLLVQKGWLTRRSGPHARRGCASCRACRRWSWGWLRRTGPDLATATWRRRWSGVPAIAPESPAGRASAPPGPAAVPATSHGECRPPRRRARPGGP